MIFQFLLFEPLSQAVMWVQLHSCLCFPCCDKQEKKASDAFFIKLNETVKTQRTPSAETKVNILTLSQKGTFVRSVSKYKQITLNLN